MDQSSPGLDKLSKLSSLRHKIDVRITSRRVGFPYGPSGHNINNCITINTLGQGNYQHSNLVRCFSPNLLTFFFSNVRSISNKVDDLTLVVQKNGIEFVGLTKTWLTPSVPDSFINIDGFNLVRKDRQGRRGGGICAFVKSTIPFATLLDLDSSEHECLWLKLRPYRLPREFSCIIVGVIYHPPQADNDSLHDYLISSLDNILTTYPTAGVIVMGDFNQFDSRRLCRNISLKQIVKEPTRANATLDLIFTNMKGWYQDPEILPAIAQSDHMSILLSPFNHHQRPNIITKSWNRKRKPSNMQAFGRFLLNLNWDVLSYLPSCQEMCDLFYDIILMGLDTIFPKEAVKIHCRDKAWLTPEIKSLISQRQKALALGNKIEYNKLRNKVIYAVKQAKPKFFESQVNHLKNSRPKKWWRAIKNLAGYSLKPVFHSAEVEGKFLEGRDLAIAINNCFLAATNSLPPLSSTDKLPTDHSTVSYSVSTVDVESRLKAVKTNKASGPDSLPNWILNSFSTELADPVTSIFNASIRQAQVPKQWKEANVIPVPKSSPVIDINVDLRPISLTATLSKILESFIYQWIMDDIYLKLDPMQFGSLKGCSTTDALISMLHCWYSNTDGNGESIRVFLLDFSKAFDRINHKILVEKIHLLNVDNPLINWIIDFLTNRRQRVKLGTELSDWSLVNGGVPQGTILGPLLFLIMINDLATNHKDRWKYVDDTSLSETIEKCGQSNMQAIIDEIDEWCTENDMVLNHSKCKDLIISFANTMPNFQRLFIKDQCVPSVLSAKVLGTYISSDLRWSLHIDHIISKASKRLFFLRVLKRCGLGESSLLRVYTTCIRPVLEYACQVWNFNIPDYLKEEIERIQKRSLRIICPHLSYRSALQASDLPPLSQRRNDLCQLYFNKLLNSEHKLNSLIPNRREDIRNYNLRNDQHIHLIKCRTSRFRNSFIPSSIVVHNNSLLC